MNFKFEWNPYADQPHNVGSRSDRFRRHLHHAASYFAIAGANLSRLFPALRGYRDYMKRMHREPVAIKEAFGCAVSPAGSKDRDVLNLLEDTGARLTVVRLPSWERDKLAEKEAFVRLLRERGFDTCLALLQRRDDVLDPAAWRGFLDEVFGRFASLASAFEIGHAWNRTKWGVWNHKEYLRLAEPAFELAPRYGAKLVGPAVIDFEFHLFPVTLPRLPFDALTSLLYVDRTGAPESAQCGWDTARKIALLKAAADVSAGAGRDVWITEVNWPLEGVGRYSPASGKPNVTEEKQADFLVRYYVICLASGLIKRVYWWQLVAPGYGLIDNREEPLRKRPGFFAFRTLCRRLEGSRFIGREADDAAEIFRFRKNGREFAVCWTAGAPVERIFDRRVESVFDRDGRRTEGPLQRMVIDGSPKYVIFNE